MLLYLIIASIAFGLEVGILVIFDFIDEDVDIGDIIFFGIIFAIIWPFSVSAALAGFILVKAAQKFDFYKKK